MIRLKSLLTEISLGGVEPYTTQFTWAANGDWREATIDAAGVPIILAMVPEGYNEWGFAIITPTADGRGVTVAHSHSAAVGQVNYLRLMSTVAEALLDFLAQWQPAAIDVTGSDTTATKRLQKTRIYRSLLSANAARLATAGYTILDRSGNLYIVRRSSADSSGITD